MRRDEHIAAMQRQQERYEEKIRLLEDEIGRYEDVMRQSKEIDGIPDDMYVNAKGALKKLNEAYFAILGSRWTHVTKECLLAMLIKIEEILRSEVAHDS